MNKHYSKDRNTRLSNRQYPPRKCIKTDCGQSFIPTDRRQQYCSAQHRIDHNNDLRKAKALPILQLQKIYKKNEAILKKIYVKLSDTEYEIVTMPLMDYEQYNFQYFTDTTINTETNMRVLWCLNYGIEGFSKENLTFKIHYRKIIPYGEQI